MNEPGLLAGMCADLAGDLAGTCGSLTPAKTLCFRLDVGPTSFVISQINIASFGLLKFRVTNSSDFSQTHRISYATYRKPYNFSGPHIFHTKKCRVALVLSTFDAETISVLVFDFGHLDSCRGQL